MLTPVFGITFTDTGLTNGQIYYYVVTAVRDGEQSAFSNEASATPFNPPPQFTVRPVIATITDTTTTITTIVVDDTPPVTVTWLPVGPAPVTVTPTVSPGGVYTATFTFTGAGTYQITVVATDTDGATTTSTITVTVPQILTAITVLTPSPPPLSGGGSDFIQTGGTDQFGNPMPPNGATYIVTSGHGTVTASVNPPGFCFHAPPNITAPETDTILMTDGTFTKTITISVTPGGAGGHWGTVNDPPQYQPVVSPQGTVVVTDPTGATSTFPWTVGGNDEAYGDNSATVYPGQSASVAVSGSASFAFTWVPDASGVPPPSTSVFLFSASASADYILAGSASADDGLGDQEQDGLGDSIPPQQEATSQGVHLKSVSSTSGTATITVSSLTSTGQCAPPSGAPYGGYIFGAGASVTLPQPVDVDVSVGSPYSGDVVPTGQYVTITASAKPLAGNNAACPLQSLTVKAQGGSGGDPTLVSFDAATGGATFRMSNPSAGKYTLVAKAMYDDSSGTPTEVDSSPSTFTVGSFTVKTNSWNPNPAYVGQIISGQVQGKFDPGSIDGGGSGSTFVVYTWSTAGVWYSQDGTAGTFEPYGGNGIVSWQQGQASTTFQAQFFAPGQYLLEVSCVATVYSSYNGSVIASFTGTGYIGGSASDIDTSGGSAGHAHKAQGLKAHDGGGAGITVVPATVTFSPSSLIKLGLGSPHDYFKQITATVTPSSQVSNVAFGASNGEVSLSIYSADPATGIVTLNVTAAGATPGLPDNSGTPDCYITATDFYTEPIASVPVIVYKPTSCTETPASSAQDSVTNICVTAGNCPPEDWGLGYNIPVQTGFVMFATLARKDITITIDDQFGQPLDSIYDGYHVVTENVAGDANSVGPISFPSGNLKGGMITDEVAVPDIIQEPTANNQFLSQAEAAFVNFHRIFTALDGTKCNVIYPVHLQGPRPETSSQQLSINGYVLSPTWERNATIYPVNYPGTIMTVTETAVPGT